MVYAFADNRASNSSTTDAVIQAATAWSAESGVVDRIAAAARTVAPAFKTSAACRNALVSSAAPMHVEVSVAPVPREQSAPTLAPVVHRVVMKIAVVNTMAAEGFVAHVPDLWGAATLAC